MGWHIDPTTGQEYWVDEEDETPSAPVGETGGVPGATYGPSPEELIQGPLPSELIQGPLPSELIQGPLPSELGPVPEPLPEPSPVEQALDILAQGAAEAATTYAGEAGEGEAEAPGYDIYGTQAYQQALTTIEAERARREAAGRIGEEEFAEAERGAYAEAFAEYATRFTGLEEAGAAIATEQTALEQTGAYLDRERRAIEALLTQDLSEEERQQLALRAQQYEQSLVEYQQAVEAYQGRLEPVLAEYGFLQSEEFLQEVSRRAGELYTGRIEELRRQRGAAINYDQELQVLYAERFEQALANRLQSMPPKLSIGLPVEAQAEVEVKTYKPDEFRGGGQLRPLTAADVAAPRNLLDALNPFSNAKRGWNAIQFALTEQRYSEEARVALAAPSMQAPAPNFIYDIFFRLPWVPEQVRDQYRREFLGSPTLLGRATSLLNTISNELLVGPIISLGASAYLKNFAQPFTKIIANRSFDELANVGPNAIEFNRRQASLREGEAWTLMLLGMSPNMALDSPEDWDTLLADLRSGKPYSEIVKSRHELANLPGQVLGDPLNFINIFKPIEWVIGGAPKLVQSAKLARAAEKVGIQAGRELVTVKEITENIRWMTEWADAAPKGLSWIPRRMAEASDWLLSHPLGQQPRSLLYNALTDYSNFVSQEFGAASKLEDLAGMVRRARTTDYDGFVKTLKLDQPTNMSWRFHEAAQHIDEKVLDVVEALPKTAAGRQVALQKLERAAHNYFQDSYRLSTAETWVHGLVSGFAKIQNKLILGNPAYVAMNLAFDLAKMAQQGMLSPRLIYKFVAQHPESLKAMKVLWTTSTGVGDLPTIGSALRTTESLGRPDALGAIKALAVAFKDAPAAVLSATPKQAATWLRQHSLLGIPGARLPFEVVGAPFDFFLKANARIEKLLSDYVEFAGIRRTLETPFPTLASKMSRELAEAVGDTRLAELESLRGLYRDEDILRAVEAWSKGAPAAAAHTLVEFDRFGLSGTGTAQNISAFLTKAAPKTVKDIPRFTRSLTRELNLQTKTLLADRQAEGLIPLADDTLDWLTTLGRDELDSVMQSLGQMDIVDLAFAEVVRKSARPNFQTAWTDIASVVKPTMKLGVFATDGKAVTHVARAIQRASGFPVASTRQFEQVVQARAFAEWGLTHGETQAVAGYMDEVANAFGRVYHQGFMKAQARTPMLTDIQESVRGVLQLKSARSRVGELPHHLPGEKVFHGTTVEGFTVPAPRNGRPAYVASTVADAEAQGARLGRGQVRTIELNFRADTDFMDETSTVRRAIEGVMRRDNVAEDVARLRWMNENGVDVLRQQISPTVTEYAVANSEVFLQQEIPQALHGELAAVARSTVRDLAARRAASVVHGQALSKSIFLDYNRGFNIEAYTRAVVPWFFWPSRTFVNILRETAAHPQLFSDIMARPYEGIAQWSEYLNAGLVDGIWDDRMAVLEQHIEDSKAHMPEGVESYLRIPIPGSEGWSSKYVYDPLRNIIPTSQWFGEAYRDRDMIEALGEDKANLLSRLPSVAPLVMALANATGMMGDHRKAYPFGMTRLEDTIQALTQFPAVRDTLNRIFPGAVPATGINLRRLLEPELRGAWWLLNKVPLIGAALPDAFPVGLLHSETYDRLVRAELAARVESGELSLQDYLKASEEFDRVLRLEQFEPGTALLQTLEKANQVWQHRRLGSAMFSVALQIQSTDRVQYLDRRRELGILEDTAGDPLLIQEWWDNNGKNWLQGDLRRLVEQGNYVEAREYIKRSDAFDALAGVDSWYREALRSSDLSFQSFSDLKTEYEKRRDDIYAPFGGRDGFYKGAPERNLDKYQSAYSSYQRALNDGTVAPAARERRRLELEQAIEQMQVQPIIDVYYAIPDYFRDPVTGWIDWKHAFLAQEMWLTQQTTLPQHVIRAYLSDAKTPEEAVYRAWNDTFVGPFFKLLDQGVSYDQALKQMREQAKDKNVAEWLTERAFQDNMERRIVFFDQLGEERTLEQLVTDAYKGWLTPQGQDRIKAVETVLGDYTGYHGPTAYYTPRIVIDKNSMQTFDVIAEVYHAVWEGVTFDWADLKEALSDAHITELVGRQSHVEKDKTYLQTRDWQHILGIALQDADGDWQTLPESLHKYFQPYFTTGAKHNQFDKYVQWQIELRNVSVFDEPQIPPAVQRFLDTNPDIKAYLDWSQRDKLQRIAAGEDLTTTISDRIIDTPEEAKAAMRAQEAMSAWQRADSRYDAARVQFESLRQQIYNEGTIGGNSIARGERLNQARNELDRLRQSRQWTSDMDWLFGKHPDEVEAAQQRIAPSLPPNIPNPYQFLPTPIAPSAASSANPMTPTSAIRESGYASNGLIYPAGSDANMASLNAALYDLSRDDDRYVEKRAALFNAHKVTEEQLSAYNKGNDTPLQMLEQKYRELVVEPTGEALDIIKGVDSKLTNQLYATSVSADVLVAAVLGDPVYASRGITAEALWEILDRTDRHVPTFSEWTRRSWTPQEQGLAAQRDTLYEALRKSREAEQADEAANRRAPTSTYGRRQAEFDRQQTAIQKQIDAITVKLRVAQSRNSITLYEGTPQILKDILSGKLPAPAQTQAVIGPPPTERPGGGPRGGGGGGGGNYSLGGESPQIEAYKRDLARARRPHARELLMKIIDALREGRSIEEFIPRYG